MSIPTDRDRAMSALGDIAGSVMLQLQVMERCAPNDIARLRAKLRQTLQEFADEVMAMARVE